MKHILNLDDAAFEAHEHGEKFAARDAPLGPSVGAKLLGYSLIAVPPGKRAYPLHNHHVNEEMFLVLEGEGTVRIGGEQYPIRKGDVIAAPPGGPQTAHQIINTSDRELRYLAVSTMIPQEVVEYPDSGKIGVTVGCAPGGDPARRTFRFIGRPGERTDYWDGE